MRKRLKFLIVEDSNDIQLRLLEMLAGVPGVEVIGCAETVAQAIDLADAGHPDVVVLDIALRHGQSSLAVLRHLQRAHPSTRAVVLSNFGGETVRESFLRDGAQACFDKALEFRSFKSWVHEQARPAE